ncbi:FeoC-like transcriptional regulator [Thalassotalea aquiviva]|uniref:FeoC-like transcriptional regulator n=1 Tax=Thalassotalea aquiviva TaxID=3242415 RepID=UPI00352A957D
MLEAIKTQLVTNDIMTAKALARALGTSEQALSGMLQLLLQRGQIETVVGGDCEGSCGCVAAKVEAYRWCEPQSQMATPLSIISVS